MKPIWKIAIVAALLCAVGGVLAMKYTGGDNEPKGRSAPASSGPGDTPKRSDLPRLLDFGMGMCTQCKIMKGILEEVRKEHPGRLAIEFVNIKDDEALADAYDIRIIPAQVFLSPGGKELFRNEGLMSKDKIAAKWAELGYDLSKPAKNAGGE